MRMHWLRAELQGLPNVILTPHIGGSTEEAQAAIGREVASSLIRFVNRGTSTGAVNFPQVRLGLVVIQAPCRNIATLLSGCCMRGALPFT